ncbi:MAG: phage tail protein [Pyrinomonadaceae bacterium]
MSTPFLGEIKIISWNFAPKGWALCNGQFLPINQNQALFSILGTTYGGNGQTTFALPDFRGRIPIHAGDGFLQGQAGGQEFHTVTQSEMPQHVHFGQVTTVNASTGAPTNNMLAGVPTFAYRNNVSSPIAINPATVTNVGGSQAHENRQPFLVLNFIIALQGIFPSRN